MSCAAWHLAGEGDAFAGDRGRPCVVFATAMGGTRDSGLLPFAEAFAEAGLDALLFDYRGYGASDGEPRQVAWLPRHREDLREAARFAAGLEGVDPGRIVLWGWSWGASHAIHTAADEPALAAALILTGPDPDGIATLRHLLSQQGGIRTMAKLNAPALRDAAAMAAGRPPELIPLVGPPGSLAALATEESEPGYTAVAGPSWRNEVAARVVLAEMGNRAIPRVGELRCPILIQGGERDSISPVESARRIAWKAKGFSELREYPCGHWGFLLELRDRVIADQLHFLRRHLSPQRAAAAAAS